MTCVIQITGNKDVGKTVLAERIIKTLKEGGYSVVAVKISHHEPDSIDKDTYRMRKAGADRVLFYNGHIYLLYTREIDCRELAADYIVVEGLREVKAGYKIHIGPNPPPDVDMAIDDVDSPVEIRCVEMSPCMLLSLIATHKI
ncbi:MAG: molybdopterin-guanine dinucleotide biosynthesis protein B [Pyrobaculum sp.]